MNDLIVFVYKLKFLLVYNDGKCSIFFCFEFGFFGKFSDKSVIFVVFLEIW